MGRSPRPRPARLAEKLLQIRRALRLTQEQLFERLDYQKSPLYLGHISEFEMGRREPSMPLLLQYARVAGVPLEVLVDDDLDLPLELLNKLEQNLSESAISLGKAPHYRAV
jgi:transcriptional regulator with XRE-family HTH domain